MAGPLQGLKVVEMVGIGPAPLCAMMLADMGQKYYGFEDLIPTDPHLWPTVSLT